MKKQNVLFLIFFLILQLLMSSGIYSQNGRQDIIKKLTDSLNVAKEDTNMVLIVDQLFYFGGYNDQLEAKKYLNKALDISKSNNFIVGLGFIHEDLGDLSFFNKDVQQAVKYYFASKMYFIKDLNKRKVKNEDKRIAKNYFNIARIYAKLNFPDSAKIFLDSANKKLLFNKIGLYNSACNYQEIAIIFSRFYNKIDLFLEYTEKGLNVLKDNSIDSCFLIAEFYEMLSYGYYTKGNADSSGYYLNLSKSKKNSCNEKEPYIIFKNKAEYFRSIEKYDSSLVYYLKILQVLDSNKKEDFLKFAECYANIGEVQSRPRIKEKMTGLTVSEDQFNKSVSAYKYSNRFYKKAMEYSKDTAFIKYYSSFIANNLRTIGGIYAIFDDSIAVDYYNEAINIFILINDDLAKSNLSVCYQEMGIFNGKANKNNQVIEFYKKALALSLELYSVDTSNIQRKRELAEIYKVLGSNTNLINLDKKDKYLLTNNIKSKEYYKGFLISLEYFQKALAIYTALNDSVNMAICFIELGYTNYRLDQNSAAISFYKNSLKFWETRKNDSLSPKYGFEYENIPLLKARLYYYIGSSYFEMKNYSASIENLKTSIDLFEKIGTKKDNFSYAFYMLALEDITLNYMQLKKYESAYFYMKKQLQSYQNNKGNTPQYKEINDIKVSMKLMLFMANPDKYLADNWYDNENLAESEYLISYYREYVRNDKDTFMIIGSAYNMAILYLLKGDIDSTKAVIRIIMKYSGSLLNDFYKSSIVGIGMLYYEIGEYKLSYDIFSSILPVLDQTYKSEKNNSIDKAEYYLYYGKVLKELGDPQNSIYALKKSADIFSNLLDKNYYGDKKENPQTSLSGCYFEIAQIYSDFGKSDSSVNYYSLALELSLKTADSNSISMIYTNLGIMLYYNGNNKMADSILNLARVYNSKKCDQCYVVNLVNNALILIKNKNFIIAKSTLDSALVIAKSIISDPKNKIVDISDVGQKILPNIYNIYGVLYEKQNEFDIALQYYQKALNELCYTKDSNIKTNPEIDKFPIDIKGALMLQNKARCLYERYKNTSNSYDYIKVAMNTNLLATKLFDKVRNSYKDEDIKIIVGTEFNDFYNTSCEIAYKAGNIENAFLFAEKSKAQVLQFIINDSKAKNTAYISDSLLIKERQLKQKLVYCKNKYKEMVNGKNLQDTLFILDQEYKNLINYFEVKFKNYYDLKYSDSTVSINHVKSKLDNSTAVLEYFAGDSSLTIFCIARDTAIMYKSNITKQNLTILTESYRNCIKITTMVGDKQANIHGYKLYELLLKPFEEYIKDSTSLIIIPDGPLMEIPFEAFLTSEPANDNPPYLIKRNAVSYHYSSTLWLNTRERYLNKQNSENQYAFLGFAPFGDLIKGDYPNAGKRESCSSALLPSSDDEIREIRNLFHSISPSDSSSCYISNFATEGSFIKNCRKYRLIDIASHGCLEDKANPYIVFYNKNRKSESLSDNGKLDIKDIFNLYPMDADLVTLSACESGMGKNIAGEGMISLVRGFLYAGASNITYSLFEVNDSDAKDLMITFYKKIALNPKEISYSKAMQKAKVALLDKETNPNLRIIDWSPIILMGIN